MSLQHPTQMLMLSESAASPCDGSATSEAPPPPPGVVATGAVAEPPDKAKHRRRIPVTVELPTDIPIPIHAPTIH